MHPRSLRGAALAAVAAISASVAAQSTSFPSLVYATVQVAGAPRDLLLDLVVPNGPGPWPLVVWVHGGGWSGGSRLPIPPAATRLVARGYAVASIDYRLSGQAIWPAQIHDCKAAIRCLRANAATYGLDGNRIGVMGSSAGGHLVAALATMGDVGAVQAGSFAVDLEGTVGPHLTTSSRVQAAVDQFGPTSMLFADDQPGFSHDAANSPESNLIGGAIQSNPEKWATVDPISFLSPDDAPILAMHGTDDTTVPFPMSELLVQAAVAIGHDSALFPVQDTGHGGPGFLAPDATAAIDAFLDRTLRDLPAVVVGITASDAAANENGDPATFVVTRTGSTAAPLTISLWAGGDVQSGLDATLLPLLTTIPAGQASVSVDFVPVQDSLVEGAEQVVLHLAPRGSYRIDHIAASARATLADDDSAVGLPVVGLLPVDAAATELPGNPGALRFVRSGPTAAPLQVSYEIAGTATNGIDYAALAGTATIPAGAATVLVVVTPLQDSQREAGETVVLRLAPSASYTRGVNRAAHVIIADDERALLLPVVGVLGSDPAIGENGGAGAFTITRTGATTAPLTVSFTLGGSATAGLDFVAASGSAVIPAGAQWVRVPLSALDDALFEGPESITLQLLPNGAYVLGSSVHRQLWLADGEATSPPASAAELAMGPLSVGAVGTATVAGAAPGGLVSLWIGLAPTLFPLPPFGTVGIDPLQAGEFVSGVPDAAGQATLPVTVPPTAALAGLPCWWQGLVLTANAPFLLLTDTRFRAITGAPPF